MLKVNNFKNSIVTHDTKLQLQRSLRDEPDSFVSFMKLAAELYQEGKPLYPSEHTHNDSEEIAHENL
jgi:hypothetical protein